MITVIGIGRFDAAKDLFDEIAVAQKAVGDEKEAPAGPQHPRRVAHELACYLVIYPNALVKGWVGDDDVEILACPSAG